MKEGERLKQFIDNQPKSKISIAKDLNITKQTLFQYFKSSFLEEETKKRFEDYFGKKIFTQVSSRVSYDTDHGSILLEDMNVDYGQPIIQVVLNLSYIGKKNADSIERMAATNERNTEIIAALVQAIVPNSNLSVKPVASPTGQHMPDDLPAEAFLNHEGIAGSQSKKKQPDKPVSKGR